jgi:hypothetical protein
MKSMSRPQTDFPELDEGKKSRTPPMRWQTSRFAADHALKTNPLICIDHQQITSYVSKISVFTYLHPDFYGFHGGSRASAI